MKHKKIIFDILVITTAFVLFMVWYRNYQEDSAITSSSRNQFYKIYLITTDKEFQYWDYINQGASAMASSIGVTYLWDAPIKRDINSQIEVVNKAVDDGANAILIATDNPKKISGPIEDAKARGVKIIYVDSPANEEAITTLATDNYDAGKIAGQTMIQELQGLGIKSGKIGIISVNKQKDNTMLREQGFREVIEADGEYDLLDTAYMNGDPVASMQAAERIIKENGDLVGLYGTNEGSSEGVGYAIKADNNRIIGVGFDKTDTMLKLLNDGSLKAIMVQNPFTMGYLGVAEAMAAIKGRDTGPSYINTGVSVLKNQ